MGSGIDVNTGSACLSLGLRIAEKGDLERRMMIGWKSAMSTCLAFMRNLQCWIELNQLMRKGAGKGGHRPFRRFGPFA
jgi:hypothetical protein